MSLENAYDELELLTVIGMPENETGVTAYDLQNRSMMLNTNNKQTLVRITAC